MGKLSPRPKKASQSHSDVKVMLIVFFIGWVSFIMGLFHVLRQSITVLAKSSEVFEGGSAKEED
jgi:ABC-type phosphate/phosphonate transport system permease subunit